MISSQISSQTQDQTKGSEDVTNESNPSSTTSAEINSPVSDFTKALREALKDPEVRSGLVDLLWPKVTSYISETLKPFQDKLEDLDMEVSLMREDLNEVKSKGAVTNKALDIRLRDLERQSKSCHLRITGLEPIPSDLAQQDCSLHARYSTALMNIVEEAGMSGISTSDFSEFTKINIPASTGASMTVLVKFTSQEKRDNLYKQRGLLKKCNNRHYVNEDLTKHDAKIFRKARNDVKEGNLVSCWTNRGMVWGKTTPEGKPFPIVE